eukprot:TRINITY_DN106156_c0_g1_i1.p1 TRINITY_DN106156_c0_g1~~TRINITY_DN106156_c0_g1_i1.p1  ORF type:complete len:431 (+),score=85.26 TRINITY_DN106156_c0_g1_i1:83-1375(+)
MGSTASVSTYLQTSTEEDLRAIVAELPEESWAAVGSLALTCILSFVHHSSKEAVQAMLMQLLDDDRAKLQAALNDIYAVERSATVQEELPADDPSEIAYWQRKPFDYTLSTEEVYYERHFEGPNQDIRPLIDYTYHRKYSNERMQFQDRLIADLSHGTLIQRDLLLPWVVFTAGAMGAGKGYIVQLLNDKGCFPLDQFTTIDPDQIRQALPEWNGYVKHDPLEAAKKTHKEAGQIAEILGYKALRERWNVIFDGSLRDVKWYKMYFERLRRCFPGIRLMILHIQAEIDEVLRRAESRGEETGRMVPQEVLLQSVAAVPISVAELAPHVDVAIRIINSADKEPQLLREPTALHPPKGVPITFEYMSRLFQPIDVDADGELSAEELTEAIDNGFLSQAVLTTVDKDGDGAISKEELKAAIQKCQDSATLAWK